MSDETATTEAAPVRLTKREIQVMRLGSEGQTSQEIADALFVSKRTIDFHYANVFRKLAVKNRVKAINAYRRLTAQGVGQEGSV